MHIIFVTPEFLSKNKASTGLPNYLYRVSKALTEMGHTPIIITGGDKKEHVYYDGIEVYREDTSNRGFMIKNAEINFLYNSIRDAYKLEKIVQQVCKEKKIDIIQYASLFGLAMFHKGKTPAIVRLSSYAKVYYKSLETYTDRFVRMMSFIERYAAKRVNGIIAPSNIMANEFQKDVHKKVTVIETPFENDVSIMDDIVLNEKIGNKKYLLFFGTLYAEKGIYVIADIIYEIFDKYPEYYFVFVGKNTISNGKNPLKTLYQKAGKYSDRVIYINPLKHEQLYSIVKNADFVTLPSLMENFSNACIEAMYFGRIVIATEGTSFEQLITDSENGFLALPNNPTSLLEKINIAINLSQEAKERMSIKAKKRIEKLRPEISVNRLIKYYKYVINNYR